MSSTKDLALKANDAAFESAIQKIAATFQDNLIQAKNDSDKQAAADAATTGIKVYKNIYEKMQQIISGIFP
jgi:LDH2 family malate/lactate/ureidoglycolate dehydrogenase